MRVAIITENFLPKRDGVTRTIDMLLEHLQMREQPAIVFAPEGSPKSHRGARVISIPGVPIPIYPELRFLFPRRAMGERLARFNPDIIHLADPMLLGMTGLYWGKRHPVTEWVTGIDLVRWQLQIASGQPLTIQQDDVRWNGSAIECRVYAEDPANQFFPSPGKITQYSEPSGPGVRVDGGVYAGWNVPLEYDPLLAKLSTWADTRGAAIARMRRAVAEFRVLGITTNLSLFDEVMREEHWIAGNLDTAFLDRFMQQRPASNVDLRSQAAAILAVVATYSKSSGQLESVEPPGQWLTKAREGLLR